MGPRNPQIDVLELAMRGAHKLGVTSAKAITRGPAQAQRGAAKASGLVGTRGQDWQSEAYLEPSIGGFTIRLLIDEGSQRLVPFRRVESMRLLELRTAIMACQ